MDLKEIESFDINLGSEKKGIYLSHQLVDVLSLVNCKNIEELENFIK